MTPSVSSSNRIGRRLFIQSLLVSVGLTILLSSIQLWLNYEDHVSTINQTIQQINRVEMRGIATALWFFSMPELKAEVEGITHFPFISYAEVQDNGRVVAAAGVKKDGGIQETLVPITYMNKERLDTIGTLYLQVDTGSVFTHLRNEVIRVFVFQAVNIWIILLFFLVLVDRQVIRHLNEAARYFRSSNLGNIHIPLELKKKHAADEIDALVETFNQMRTDFINVVEQRHEVERKHAVLLSNLPGMAFHAHHGYARSMELVSAGSLELTGYQPEELMPGGNTLYGEIIHPDDHAFVRQAIRRAADEKQVYEIIYRIQTAQQQIRWVLEKGIVMVDRESQSPLIEGFVIDITERKQQERQLEAIARISYALRSARAVDKMLPVILEQAMELLYAESGTVELVEPGSGDAVVVMASGGYEKMLGVRFAYNEGLSSLIRRSGNPFINNHMSVDPPVPLPENARFHNSLAGVPMIANSELIGFLWIARNTYILEGEVRILSEIADIAANAIHRANLFHQTEQRLRQLVALQKIDTAINRREDMHDTLNLLIEQAKVLLGIDAGQILLLEPDSNIYHFRAAKGFHTQTFEQLSDPLGASSADVAVLQQMTVQYCDVQASPPDPVTLDKMRLEGFRSFFAVPLVSKNAVKGILQVFRKDAFTPAADWIEFLETLAGQAAIAVSQANLLRDLQHRNWELRMAYDQTIEGWSNALDLRDRETEGHSQRVCDLTLKLAGMLGLQGEDLTNIRRGSLLHDIGKMGVPDEILLKPGKLAPEEWTVMWRHPDYAYQLLSPIEYLYPALDIPYCHHEKWDGTGYPRGLKGLEIPLAARIFAVVDVWDALTSDRPYRRRVPNDEVLQYIVDQSGKHFDPEIVKLFMQVITST